MEMAATASDYCISSNPDMCAVVGCVIWLPEMLEDPPLCSPWVAIVAALYMVSLWNAHQANKTYHALAVSYVQSAQSDDTGTQQLDVYKY